MSGVRRKLSLSKGIPKFWKRNPQNGPPMPPAFQLPNEIWLWIFSFLRRQDLSRICRCARYFFNLLKGKLHRRRCILFNNSLENAEGRLISVPATVEQLLQIASQKLNIKAQFAFTKSGIRIKDVSCIYDDEEVYISQGEPFYKRHCDFTVKLGLVGHFGVDKSSLVIRFTRNVVDHLYDPTIEDAFRRQIDVDGCLCRFDILDTTSAEDMKFLRTSWILNLEGFLLVYSISDRQTLYNLREQYEEIKQVHDGDVSKLAIVVVGNKTDWDQPRQVSFEEGQTIAKQIGAIKYIETSAKTGENIEAAFASIARFLLRQKLRNQRVLKARLM